MRVYLGDPIWPDINPSSATSVNTGLLSVNTHVKYVNNLVNVALESCAGAECTDYATNKVFLTSKDGTAFYVCGFGIMASLPSCAPSANQCSHSQLGTMATTPAAISLSVGDTSSTTVIKFPDPLSEQCFTLSSGLKPGCSKSYSFKCCVGSGCTTTTSIMSFGTIPASSANSVTLTVAPTSVSDVGTYNCEVTCTLDTQTKTSSKFEVKVCPSCATATLSATSAFTPSFPTAINIGTTGATSIFTAPTNSATQCSGTACGTMSYALSCRKKLVGGSYVALTSWTATVDQTNLVTPTINAKGSDIELHGVVWECQMKATNSLTSSTALSNTFEISFTACVSVTQSCPAPLTANPSAILWDQPLTQNPSWVQPLDLIVYIDNVPISNTLDYSKWKDSFTNKCATNFCGVPSYTYIDNNGVTPFPLAAAATWINNKPATETVTFTVKTTDVNLVGIYQVAIQATLDTSTTTAWTGIRPTSTWIYFNVQIVDPCGQSPKSKNCMYTKLVASASVQTPMSITLNGAQSLQNFAAYTDYISTLCGVVCPETAKTYSLINVATGLPMPTDLAGIQKLDSTTAQIFASTNNFAYTGVYQVYVQCTLNLYSLGGTGTSFLVGNTFTLTVDACASCAQTTLIALGAGDTQPTSYSIGVENTPGFTLFSTFQNQAAKYCNVDSQCGTPTYALICVLGCTAGSSPPFSSIITVDGSGKMKQSTQTTDSTLAGVYTVKIVATLSRAAYQIGATPSVLYTNNFVITIDACTPLPCEYNSIIAPVITGSLATVNHLPSAQVAMCNGTVASDYFTSYTDTVSKRCSGATYVDKCGPKQYKLEQSPSGTPLPLSLSVSVTTSGANQAMSISTIDCLIVNIYNTQIRASFVTPTTSVSDNTEVTFLVSVEFPDPCTPLICAANSFSTFDTQKDTYPTDISIWVDNVWGQSNFTNFRDSKSDKCDGLPGTVNGVLIDPLQAPVCGYPTYDVYLASTNTLLSATFGGSNIIVSQVNGGLLWQLQVRSGNRNLRGTYQIYIQGTLLTQKLRSNTFTLTVQDDCNPYDCSLTSFYPQPTGLKPQNITVMVGQGYVKSNQALWTDTITDKCSNTITGPLCGVTQFMLLQSNGSSVPFQYLVTSNGIYTQVAISVVDPLQVGQVYLVYLQGFQVDANNISFGLGSSSVFSVTIIASNAADYGSLTTKNYPVFDFFPDDQAFVANATYSSVTLEAIASVVNGTIVAIYAQLGSASQFVSYKNSTGAITFYVVPTSTVPTSDYNVKVFAVDQVGNQISKSFKISIQKPVNLTIQAPTLREEQKKEMEQLAQQMKSSNTTDTVPITAWIESISLTGLVEIKFSKAVLRVKDVAQLTYEEIFLTLKQNSYERDQTLTFSWTVTKSTPFRLFVQLNFEFPLDISQGIKPDQINVWLREDTFMIKDTIGLYKAWKESTQENKTTTWPAVEIIDMRYQDPSIYAQLQKNIPQQVQDVSASTFLVNYNLNNIDYVAKAMFWAPFILQFTTPQAMEKTWLLFGSLQIMNIVTQLQLKTPTNVLNLAKVLQPTANSQFFDQSNLYGWLKRAASDKNQSQSTNSSNLTAPANKTGTTTRRLIATNMSENVSTNAFENSKFYGHGSTEKIIECAAQLLVGLVLLFAMFLFILFVQKSFMHWMPEKFREAFLNVKRRFYYSLPLRILCQQYMQVTLGAFINLKMNMEFQHTEQKTNTIIAVVLLAFYSLLFPIWMILFLRKYKHTFSTDQIFAMQWNTICLKVDLRNNQAMFLLAFNLIRRFLLIFVAVELSYPLIQLICVLYIQTVFTLYVLYVRPMNDSIGNSTLIFNELLITTLCIILFTFTEFVPYSLVRYNLGWIFLYLVYLVILITTGVWVLDVYQMTKRQYQILKYKRALAQRKNKINQHNKLVDVIGKHNEQTRNQVFKRRNNIVEEQLASIVSLGSQEDSSRSVKSKQPIESERIARQTIAERKLEFQQQMVKMKRNNDFDEDVRIKQLLQIEEAPQLQLQRNAPPPRAINQYDDIFAGLIPEEPISNTQLIQQQIQKDSDWPISARHAHVQKAVEAPQNQNNPRQERWSWDNELEGSNASRWNAMPSDYDDSSIEEDKPALNESRNPVNHVGKISQLATLQQKDDYKYNDNMWVTKQEQDAPIKGMAERAGPVFKSTKQRRFEKTDPFEGLI